LPCAQVLRRTPPRKTWPRPSRPYSLLLTLYSLFPAALTLPLPRQRRPSPPSRPSGRPAIRAPPPTAPPGSVPASSSPAPVAPSCAPQSPPSPWWWPRFLPSPDPSAYWQATPSSGPTACPQPTAAVPRRPCAPFSPGSPFYLYSCCLFFLSPSLDSTSALIRPSFRHFRPCSTNPRARGKRACGNPSPESPRKLVLPKNCCCPSSALRARAAEMPS